VIIKLRCLEVECGACVKQQVSRVQGVYGALPTGRSTKLRVVLVLYVLIFFHGYEYAFKMYSERAGDSREPQASRSVRVGGSQAESSIHPRDRATKAKPRPPNGLVAFAARVRQASRRGRVSCFLSVSETGRAEHAQCRSLSSAIVHTLDRLQSPAWPFFTHSCAELLKRLAVTLATCWGMHGVLFSFSYSFPGPLAVRCGGILFRREEDPRCVEEMSSFDKSNPIPHRK
jgi:hypothetical protein